VVPDYALAVEDKFTSHKADQTTLKHFGFSLYEGSSRMLPILTISIGNRGPTEILISVLVQDLPGPLNVWTD